MKYSYLLMLIVLITSTGINAILAQDRMSIIATGDALTTTGIDNDALVYRKAEPVQELGWLPGTAHYPDGNQRNFDELRFDPEKNIVEIRVRGNTLELLPGVVSAISFRSEGHLVLVIVVVNIEELVYMEVLSGGPQNLLVYRTKGINREEVLDTSVKIILEKQEIVLPWEDIFYVGNQKAIKELRLTRKRVLKALSNKKKEVEALIDDNRLTIINPDDLVRIFDFYNSLAP